MQGLKINECGDQIVPIPIQRNNCIESVRLRKEILVNSAKMQESVQPLLLSHIVSFLYLLNHPHLGRAIYLSQHDIFLR